MNKGFKFTKEIMLIQLDKVCTYLKTCSSLATLVSDRIYFGEPMREQTWPYIVLNSISQIVWDTTITKQALIEARIIGHDENDTKKSLVTIASALNDELITTYTNELYTLSWFEVYKIIEGWDFRIFIDEKNRNLLIKDYVFYFLS